MNKGLLTYLGNGMPFVVVPVSYRPLAGCLFLYAMPGSLESYSHSVDFEAMRITPSDQTDLQNLVQESRDTDKTASMVSAIVNILSSFSLSSHF